MRIIELLEAFNELELDIGKYSINLNYDHDEPSPTI